MIHSAQISRDHPLFIDEHQEVYVCSGRNEGCTINKNEPFKEVLTREVLTVLVRNDLTTTYIIQKFSPRKDVPKNDKNKNL